MFHRLVKYLFRKTTTTKFRFFKYNNRRRQNEVQSAEETSKYLFVAVKLFNHWSKDIFTFVKITYIYILIK